MNFLRWLFEAQIPVGGSVLILREVLGNIFGLASAVGGMRRRVWAWPVGIAGNLLLLTVFLGNVFGSATPATLWGQAGRQVMFIGVAAYGWYRWRQAAQASGAQTRGAQASGGHANGAAAAIAPRWASNKTRLLLAGSLLAGTIALTPVFDSLGSYPPVWADAWTFVGSLLATYGMARGWTEFWLIWVAVDIVGVPLLFSAGYFASAFMYLFYGFFTLTGFFVWWRASRVLRSAAQSAAQLVPDAAARDTAALDVAARA